MCVVEIKEILFDVILFLFLEILFLVKFKVVFVRKEKIIFLIVDFVLLNDFLGYIVK